MRRCIDMVALGAALWLWLAPAGAQESIIKAEQLIGLQQIPLAKPTAFEALHTAEQIDYLGWIALRAIDPSSSWNPRIPGWGTYRANIRYGVEQELRQRWQSAGGIVRSIAQNPDTSLAKFYADTLQVAGLDEALAFYRSDAGKKYLRYQRELSRAYYYGLVELDRISIDPAFGGPGATVADRRKAWLADKKLALDPAPPGYEFHLKAAQLQFAGAKPADTLHALFVAAPPGTPAFTQLDQQLAGADRDAVNRYLQSPVFAKEREARRAWGEAVAKTRDVLPLLISDLRGLADVVGKWKKLRADPGSLPKSIAQVDPASVSVSDEYKLSPVEEAVASGAARQCLPGTSDDTLRHLTDSANGRSYKEVTRVMSNSSASNILVARQGIAACIPTTVPGYPVPAVNSFIGTIRVVGMEEAEAKNWYRAIAQEIGASGVSDSLIVFPNGNAIEVTYATNLQSPQALIYSNRFLFAGSYDAARYRTVHRVAGIKSISTTGSSVGGVTRYEKSLVTTPEDVKRAQDMQR